MTSFRKTIIFLKNISSYAILLSIEKFGEKHETRDLIRTD